jgi:hypothetical protein
MTEEELQILISKRIENIGIRQVRDFLFLVVLLASLN